MGLSINRYLSRLGYPIWKLTALVVQGYSSDLPESERVWHGHRSFSARPAYP